MKRLAARTDHKPNDTHDHSEITASDVTVSGQEKRGLDSYILGGTVNAIPLNSGSIIEGISYDYLYIDRPDNVTEIYTYRIGGPTGEVQALVRAIYTSGSEKYLQSIERLDL